MHGTNTLGVALDKEVYVGQLQNDDLVKISRIPLDELVYSGPSGDFSLLEFKLINESSALVCTSNGCIICSRNAMPIPTCHTIPLRQKQEKWSGVSATLVNNGIMLRTISDKKDNASIYYLLSGQNSSQLSNDAPGHSEFETVAAFSTTTHSYFVGSAKRMDRSLYPIKNETTRYNTDVRITRICNADRTDNLRSRVDLVLSCGGIDYRRTEKAITNKATAAFYSPYLEKLLIAFQHGEEITQNYICSYDLENLKSLFANTWNMCQSLAEPLDTTHCQGPYANLKNECFLFSWDNPTSQPYCSAYNGKKGSKNCQLHATFSLNKAYGSLENFKPHDGELLFKENHKEPIVAIREVSNDGALYALRKDDHLIRLLDGVETSSDLLSTFPTQAGNYMLEVVPNNNELIVVTQCDDACNMTVAFGSTEANCTTENPQKHPCVVKVKDSFKSTIKKTTRSRPYNSGIFTIVNPTTLSQAYTKIPYYTTTANPNQKRTYSDETTTISDKTEFTYPNVVVAILAVLCLFAVLWVVLIHYQSVKTELPLKALPDQLNPNKLIILKSQPLGSGVSATVYKGSFKTSTSEYERVAVKIFNEIYAHFMNTEFIDELKVLRQIQHPNIVGFIGHAYIDRTLHIVTEYMAGGSLHDYIKDGSTVLKYQNSFDYLDQILSAMVYLSQQQIVHRDLAARNCLLNGDHTILKVSDFGLARSVDFKGEYQILHIDTALPTRWIALEAFSQHKFTEKSDVWSFGVLVWELFTRGNTPYFPLDHGQILEFLNEGRRLQCPVTCPEQIYALIVTCWDSKPKRRPSFKQLQKDMTDVIRCLMNANKKFVENKYERPSNQPLRYYKNNAVTAV
uniref:receptor protein-tyrosine kinase n=1 Tax=Panagrellus redivivus TaxID=6233 RepID=A0A7E4VHJ6_PANRE